jgi:hypothetical protein
MLFVMLDHITMRRRSMLLDGGFGVCGSDDGGGLSAGQDAQAGQGEDGKGDQRHTAQADCPHVLSFVQVTGSASQALES